MNKRTLLLGGAVAVVALFIIGLLLVLGGRDSAREDALVEIEERYEDKIFYTTDLSQDESKYRNHCEAEGGTFNSCGSPCPTNSEACVKVCAFTCEWPALSDDEEVNVDSDNRAIVRSKIGESVTALGLVITPVAVQEDSRCPIDVICVQMGRVVVEVEIESGLGTASEAFEIGTTITTEAEAVTLIDVEPEISTSEPDISAADYEFTFEVRRRM